jgi:hypothetical protein
MEDGARRHIHINKLRPFLARVNAVMRECDVDFGRVVTAPDLVDDPGDSLLPSQKIDLNRLAHLTETERTELLQVLDRFPECFVESQDFVTLYSTKLSLLKGSSLSSQRLTRFLKS